jgi:hypothetical protein
MVNSHVAFSGITGDQPQNMPCISVTRLFLQYAAAKRFRIFVRARLEVPKSGLN